MPVEYKLEPIYKIEAKLGINPNGDVQSFFTDMCYKKMGKFVPGGEEGLLNTEVSKGTYFIDYNSPYAHYMYMGILYVDPETKSPYAKKHATKVPTGKKLKYHTPGTGSHWAERMWSSQGKKVVKEVENYIKKRG